MIDTVILLYEDGGRPVARHRFAFPQPEYQGEFSYEEGFDRELKRTVVLARLQDGAGRDVLPPLYEAKLIWCKAGQARVSGLEVDEVTRKRTAQCWNVRFAGCSEFLPTH